MILETLKLDNFRVFEGEHVIDLAPRVKREKKRPIILFGGLNGAGKTTTLTAVRLALYGKLSLGYSTSVKDYHHFLEKCIHEPKNRQTKPNSAAIELTFSYANLGVEKQYTIHRRWIRKSKAASLKEYLSISENGKVLDELTAEQCQGFLNELVPIGVSDLFFFDGEKIAELAEDKQGDALGDSIKKLLGLDLIDTLKADLGILVRKEAKKNSIGDVKKEISRLESQLFDYESQALKALEKYEQERTAELFAKKEIEDLNSKLSSKGGAWAASREETIRLHAQLTQQKKDIERRVREVISGSFPLSIAADFALHTIKQLKNESEFKQHTHTSKILKTKLVKLNKSLRTALDADVFSRVHKILESELSDLTDNAEEIVIVHDVSESILAKIETTIKDAINTQKDLIDCLSDDLEKIDNELESASRNIARAPEREQLIPLVDKIADATKRKHICYSRQLEFLSEHKKCIREAQQRARELDKLSLQLRSSDDDNRMLLNATSVRKLLDEFSSELSFRKVKDLEAEFINSFYRLARKEDIDLSARIDPTNFSVSLHSLDGKEVNKEELSAGEKQIYAISILEALARTSGRRLPIIIDTPLGRLDSIHRTKLVKNYFPYASHQVLILSTDTEVDENFYKELSPNISHAFKIDYDSKSGASKASEGYFWRKSKGKVNSYAS